MDLLSVTLLSTYLVLVFGGQHVLAGFFGPKNEVVLVVSPFARRGAVSTPAPAGAAAGGFDDFIAGSMMLLRSWQASVRRCARK